MSLPSLSPSVVRFRMQASEPTIDRKYRSSSSFLISDTADSPLRLCSLIVRPIFTNLTRQDRVDLFRFPRRYVFSYDPQNGARNVLRIDVRGAAMRELLPDLSEERILFAVLERRMRRNPSFVIEASDEDRQLRPKLRDLR